ncbi:type I polyketide synthase, partial [Streptomyces sp. NPDC058335]|uniref:type I polyketide synthase n=1 Tax=Streptomyces sp. NPDC058335 TaxID=3346451 RepID=UPI003662C5D2
MNQDGASNGLTAPSGPAQERVIRAALGAAGLSVSDVDVVEGHGTGTSLGDPIEAQALLATYGQGRVGGPLWLGSLKSNIGHTQAAAGVSGVIKMVMAMRHGVLPRTLHVDVPSPVVDWASGAVELLVEEREWPGVGRPRRAGVSSFGVSGTNAHVIVEQAPDVVEEDVAGVVGVPGVGIPLVVSGKSDAALSGQAGRLVGVLGSGVDVGGVAAGLVLSRGVFDCRGVVWGEGVEGLLSGVGVLAGGGSGGGVVRGSVVPGEVGFLFSGQGSQWVGMGRGLYEAFPVFAAAFDEVCGCFGEGLSGVLRGVVFEGVEGVLGRTEFTQPALFAVEVALFRLVESWGVRPGFVAGHSVGEVAAACVAGVLSLGDACRLVEARGRLMGGLPVGGVMVAVEASEEEVVARVEGVEGVGVAAVNGPRSVVVSGAEGVVEEVVAFFRGVGRRVKRLEVSHAFHSPLMEPMVEEFRGVVSGLEFGEPSVGVVSMVSGRVVQGGEWSDPEYWVRHVGEPVRFADGVEALAGAGVSVFVEVGPGAVLTALGRGVGVEGEFVALMRAGRSEVAAFVEGVSRAFVAGAEVDWAAVLGVTGRKARAGGLPTYAFQRERYWLE